MLFRAHEGLVMLADKQIGAVVMLGIVTVHHVPVVTHHHALLEQGLFGTSMCEAAALSVTHVVQLPTIHILLFVNTEQLYLELPVSCQSDLAIFLI
jgi:hypothetical protein